jgi:hypothetical protein
LKRSRLLAMHWICGQMRAPSSPLPQKLHAKNDEDRQRQGQGQKQQLPHTSEAESGVHPTQSRRWAAARAGLLFAPGGVHAP